MVRIGVIGAGGIANNIHLPSLTEIETCEVIAICDCRRERAEKTAERFKIPKVYDNFYEMFDSERLDAAFILVWPEQGPRVLTECMERNIPAFIEKPAGITLYQAERLCEMSERKNSLVQVGFNRRFIPLVTKVLEIFREASAINQIGGVFFKHGSPAFYVGCSDAFTCDVVHVADVLRFIAGSPPKKGALLTGSYNEDEPNAWNAVFNFENGITSTIRSNYDTGGRVHQLELLGSGASAFINIGFGGERCEADILFFRGGSSHSISAAGAKLPEAMHLDGKEIAGSDKYYRYYGYYTEDALFIDSVAGNKKSACSLADSLETMKLLDFLLKREL